MHNINPTMEMFYIEFDNALRDENGESYLFPKVQHFLNTVESLIHEAEVASRISSMQILNSIQEKVSVRAELISLPNGEVGYRTIMNPVLGFVQEDDKCCLVMANNWTFLPQQYFIDRKNALRKLKNDLKTEGY